MFTQLTLDKIFKNVPLYKAKRNNSVLCLTPKTYFKTLRKVIS